jgi:hypothetical protein
MKRRLLIAAVVLTGAWYAARPLLRAERFRENLHQALERSLERKVDITGAVTYSLWNGPGFSIANVVIHEDPAVGIEPFAYVTQLDATVRVFALLRGRLEVERIVLDEPRVNLVKQESGAWNVRQFLAKGKQGGPQRGFPEIRVRAGRINLKFGDTKSVLYLSNADLDVTPSGEDRIDVQFRVEPARTDRPAQGIGTLSGNGRYRWFTGKPGQLELDFDLQRSAISDLVSLLEGRGAGMRGFLASRASIKGPLDQLKIEGSLGLEDIQRWDITRGLGKWPVRYTGSLDFLGGTFELDSRAEGNPAPFHLRLKANHIFDNASWGSLLEFKEMPFSTLRDLLAYMNVATPERVALEGKISGVVSYSSQSGLQGLLETPEASVKGGDASFTLRAARVAVDQSAFQLMPAQLVWGDGQSAEVDGYYGPGGYSLRWRTGTQFMPVDDFMATQARLVGGDLPLLSGLEQGQWRGTLECVANAEGSTWNGAFALRDARLSVPGLASPILLKQASGSLQQNKVAFDSFTGTAGKIAFQGSLRGSQWKLAAEELDVVELEKLFLPTLKRSTGFLRTITRRAAPLPEWLADRKLTAAVQVGGLWAGDVWLGALQGRVDWNGAVVDLSGARWERDDAMASGKVTLRLTGWEPAYKVAGTITKLPWRGSAVEGELAVQSTGTGLLLLRNAKANGTFVAKALGFTPDDFRNATGAYELSAPRGTPVLKLSSIEASGGPDVFTGQGATEADGRLVVDLANGRKKLRLAGTVWPFQLEPLAAR